MALKKRTDQLPAILSGDVDNNDLMYLVHENAQAETGYDSKKILVSDVGRKLNNGVEYATELPSFPSGYQNPLDALELLKQEILDLYPVDSASGSIANFTTSLAMLLVALKTNIVAQGGGGTPSAPVAITGVSSIELTCADGEMQTVDTFTLSLGQTIYGGYVDWENGEGYITCVKLTLNGDIATSDLRLTAQTGFTQIEWYPYRTIGKGNETFKCDKFEFNIEKGLYRVSNNNLATAPRMFFGLPDTVTTREEAVAWFASNPTEIVYELATPTPFSITPTTMPQTISGEQNWFADSGDIELEYKMGVQEYIDKKIAEVQALVL